jgi:hypothetical protein
LNFIARLCSVGAALLLIACSPAVDAPSGAAAQLRIAGARFVTGDFPAIGASDAGIPEPDAGPDSGAPTAPPRVQDVAFMNTTVRPGTHGRSIAGRVTQTAMTVAIGLDGDPGYWIIPVGSVDVESPPDLDFSASMDFGGEITVGTHRLFVAAADRHGSYGARSVAEITVTNAMPDGELVVGLTWDHDMDLDLLVLQPDGNTLTFRGLLTAAGARMRAPLDSRIDADSNAACVIDGRREENAIYSAPPSGQYEVRVRVASACRAVSTSWRVRIARRGTVVAELLGTSNASEVDAPGGGPMGTGQRAAIFSVGE